MARIDAIFEAIKGGGASDLHISAGSQPMVRVNGEIVPIEHEALSGDTFAEPSKSGALELIYAHLLSLRNIGLMVARVKGEVSATTDQGDWVI